MNSHSFFLQPRTKGKSQQIVQSPKAMSETDGSHPRSSEDPMAMESVMPSYQCLMKNLEIRSPVSSRPMPTPTKTKHLTPKLSQSNNESPLQPPLDVVLGAMAHQSTPSVGPRSGIPLFDHHQGSPFMHHHGSPFSKLGRDVMTPVKSTQAFSTPSPKLRPLKVLNQQSNASTPFDPSTTGNSMKRSPLVKSIDATPLKRDDALSPPNLGSEFSTPQKTVDQGHPPFPSFKLTPISTPLNGHPPLPSIKLTPRSTPRRGNGNGNGHPPLPAIRLTPRFTPRKRDLDQNEACLMMDLTPKVHRKVSVGDESFTSRNSKSHPSSPDVSMTSADPMISMVLSIGSNSTRQELRHFPRTPKMSMKKSRSLFDPDAKDESIETLRCADAMVEVARANESLTDDEDDDHVLLKPPSFGSNKQVAKSDNDAAQENEGFISLDNKPSFLPMPALNHSNSSTSLLGIKHLQDASEQEKSANDPSQSEAVDTGQFQSIQPISSMCSLALSVDSMSGDAKRDLFTPPPVLQNKEGFRALSPPPLLPNSKQSHW